MIEHISLVLITTERSVLSLHFSFVDRKVYHIIIFFFLISVSPFNGTFISNTCKRNSAQIISHIWWLLWIATLIARHSFISAGPWNEWSRENTHYIKSELRQPESSSGSNSQENPIWMHQYNWRVDHGFDLAQLQLLQLSIVK